MNNVKQMCHICTSGWQSWCTDVVLMIMELFSKVQVKLISPKKERLHVDDCVLKELWGKFPYLHPRC